MPNKDISQLLKDDSFVNYCLDRNDEDIHFWQNWLMENPDQREKVREVRAMVLLLGSTTKELEVEEGFNLLKQRMTGSAIPAGRKSSLLYLSFTKIAGAAAVLVFLSIGAYFLLHKEPAKQIALKTDLLPGGNKAILTLSNGKQISLTDAQNGIIAEDNETQIKKANDGTVSYAGIARNDNSEQPAYNIITTPKGGQWPAILLPDGSKVILDAASSIKYPVSFKGKDRKVFLTGQAYFEVVHHSDRPFKVEIKGQTIEDIGTHFNINAYENEPVIRTTLLEGAVKINRGAQSAIIRPGQEAITQEENDVIRIGNADLEEAVAWKNGFFMFNGDDLPTIMRKIARWYDVDVAYEMDAQARKGLKFGGFVSRSKNLSVILNTMERTGKIHFRVEGKKITIIN